MFFDVSLVAERKEICITGSLRGAFPKGSPRSEESGKGRRERERGRGRSVILGCKVKGNFT